jgi:hypothetical protein
MNIIKDNIDNERTTPYAKTKSRSVLLSEKRGYPKKGNGKMSLSRRNTAVIFAVVLFAAAAFMAVYETPDESDAAPAPIPGTNVSWELVGGTLTISGAGQMPDYTTAASAPWHWDRSLITSAVIDAGVTSVGKNAFSYCPNLVNVDLSDSVKTIGENAFYYCTNLGSIDLSKVTTIGKTAFLNCDSLISVDLRSVKIVEDEAFHYCDGLLTVNLSSVEEIKQHAFGECRKLQSVSLGNSVKTIGNWAFEICGDLAIINLSSVEDIGYQAFLSCFDLKSVELSSKVRIGGSAFQNCRFIETVTVTGDHGNGQITGGVVDKYFKNGNTWDLEGADAIMNLRLPHTAYRDYLPNNSGIVGDRGMTLAYSDAKFGWDTAASRWGYSVSGTLRVIGGPPSAAENVSLTLTDSVNNVKYNATTGSGGVYEIFGHGLPMGTSGSVTATLSGYTQDTPAPSVSLASAGATGVDLILRINTYTVTLTAGTGISGFTYEINGNGTAINYNGPFAVNHGDSLKITAAINTGYVFDRWSSSSTSNPLTISGVTGNMDLTAAASTSGVVSDFTVTFDSDSKYTVYIGDSPVQWAIKVGPGGKLIFEIHVSDGYTASPALDGIAKLSEKTNGWEIYDILSNVHVKISVQSDGGEGTGGEGTGGDGTGGGSGDGEGWAVLNLALALMAVITGVVALVTGRGDWRYTEDDTERGSIIPFIMRMAALIIGIVSLVIFFLTEDISLDPVMMDAWTPLSAILLIIVLIVTMVSFRVTRD